MMVRMAISATFIFALSELDDRFHALNDEIAERARRIPGFLGEEAWHDETTGLHSEVYYWQSRDALAQLAALDTHLVAKRDAATWILSYRVVIAEVIAAYGHPTLGLAHIPDGAPAPAPSAP
jgi:heme-degrading monooxygenase HmoA